MKTMECNYENIGISNDFMFGYIMKDPKKCKPFLEQILGFSIHHIEYIERQKGVDMKIDARSIRMDIYVEDGSTVYNCEMQTTSNRNLPKRSRYYQGQIDLNLISKGADFKELKRSFIIFICTFDPFGEDRYLYTFENTCRENPDLHLNDEAIKLFVNTKGTKGNVSRQFKELVHFLDTSEVGEDCENNLVHELKDALERARNNTEWRHDYMTWEMMRKECREEGREEGRIMTYFELGWSVPAIAEKLHLGTDFVEKVLEGCIPKV